MTKYPTLKQVKTASKTQLANWFMTLPFPGHSCEPPAPIDELFNTIRREREIMNRIEARLNQLERSH